jgi:hypothetical protein
MSAIIKANTAYRAGLITDLSDEGERQFDAISADVIPQGAVLFNDYANATPGLRGYKIVGTAGAERGPYAVCTKAKIAGTVKVTGVEEGRVTVTAGGTIAGGAWVKPSVTTAGAVDQFALTDNPLLKVGRYTKLAKYANSNDGNHALAAATAGDVIVIELDE